MISSLKFIGWKTAELLVFVAGFPFFFVGAWAIDISDWCHDRALRHQPPADQNIRRNLEQN